MTDIPIATNLSIRECGLDEYWLQNQIFENPSAIGLGDLESVGKEKRQSSGGRLDILLKNPEDDSMFEIEVMLGDTDETHIIRTIEYWDNEKRKYPQRQHYAVLIAENITRRFFNVIHLLSHSIPIIGIQAGIIEVNGSKSLVFNKIIDTYEEIEDGSTDPLLVVDKSYWNKKGSWVVDAASTLNEIASEIIEGTSVNYTKTYVSVAVQRNICFWVRKRSSNKVLIGFRVLPNMVDEVKELLEENSITYIQKSRNFKHTTDIESIQKNRELYIELAKMVNQRLDN